MFIVLSETFYSYQYYIHKLQSVDYIILKEQSFQYDFHDNVAAVFVLHNDRNLLLYMNEKNLHFLPKTKRLVNLSHF